MATKRRRDDESRISQLPEPILHHILSLLSQKEAIQTCVLSKSWRHLGPTRPNVVLRQSSFFSYWYRDKKKFVSVLDKTLQTYQDQKHSIQDLHLEMSSLDSESSSILEKLVKNLNVMTFRLAFIDCGHFSLPRLIFQAASLKEIYLTRLKLTTNIDDKVLFKHLHTLHLEECYIEDDTFVKIISSCPLIEYLVLHYCKGLKTIKLNKAHNLKLFDCTFFRENISFNNHFPHLKSLYLCYVRLSAESFQNLSSDNFFPCLEELKLKSCHGFEEFVLSSRSIKRLIIKNMSCKGAIDAANILFFKVSNTRVLPPSISLTTTSKEWKSQVDMFLGADTVSTCLHKINELLKGLSQSQISFKPSYHNLLNGRRFMGKPAVVEHIDLSRCHSFHSYPDILICFFRICRPRYIIGMCSGVTAETELRSGGEITFGNKIIIKDRVGMKKQRCFWQRDLVELSSEVWDHNAKEWHHVRLGTLSSSTLRALSDKHEIRYRLKWREEKTG